VVLRDVIAGCYCGMLLLGVISTMKKNEKNEILLAPCEAGYVQQICVTG
jgi:hypothetical protein